MSTLLRSILILALTVTSGSAARADPPAVSARYSTNWPAIVAGDPITLQEFGLSPVGAQVTRRIDWGDGSPVQVETGGDRWEHLYAAAGTFHVSVALGGWPGRLPVRRHRHRLPIGAALAVVGELPAGPVQPPRG
jgi:hypothetical protein